MSSYPIPDEAESPHPDLDEASQAPVLDELTRDRILKKGDPIDRIYPERIFLIFREYCRKSGLSLMGGLLGFDFGQLSQVPGLGAKKLRLIQERWAQYVDGLNVDESVMPKPRSENVVTRSSEHIDQSLVKGLFSDPAVIEKLTDVLSGHFTNGFRLNSPIELARFRAFAVDDLGEETSLTDEELKKHIMACGTSFDGKVYAVSARAKERIKELANEYFADGAQAIFFAEFYAKNENWLFGASVVSEDMLIGILRRLFPNLSFTLTYFGFTDATVITVLENEILRVWGDGVLKTYEQLAERLQYIPIERIKHALGQNSDFIWSSAETFSHISKIGIVEAEREAIREAAVREYNTRGYAIITDLPFGEIEERNYELSRTAIHNAVFRICLSDKFDKHGKIVTRKGDALDALTIMKEHCRTIDKCSIGDLLNYEKELTGEDHLWIAMEAGNAVLVRIDKDTYVADRHVQFDSDTIDQVIERFVKDDYLPLKSFTTFGAFPNCGQPWNLFLLESYCRRFSREYRFDAPSVNSRNAGAVIRKSCRMSYFEIIADAVALSSIPLEDSVVGKYLFDGGYAGRSMTAKVGEIVDKAKAIREMRG